MQKLGFIILCLGTTMADSENLLIPIAVVTLGAVLILLGKEKENDGTR